MLGRKKERLAASAEAEWVSQRGELVGMIEAAENFKGLTAAQSGISLQLKAKELGIAQFQPCQLVESRRGPGHYTGASSGFSFKVAKGVRYRVGASKGTYVQGAEAPTSIDTGSFIVTTGRAVFVGTKQTREWAWPKLLTVEHQDDVPVTMLHVSNRQKASGVLVGWDLAPTLRFRVALALALFNNTTADLAAQLRRDLEAHDRAKPAGLLEPDPQIAIQAPASATTATNRVADAVTPIAASPPVGPPAGWYTDPQHEHELRWWDGQQWTAHVSDGGLTS